MQTWKILLAGILAIPSGIIGRWYRSQYHHATTRINDGIDELIQYYHDGRMIKITTSSPILDETKTDNTIYTGRVLDLEQQYQLHLSGTTMQLSGTYFDDDLAITSSLATSVYGTATYITMHDLQSNAARDKHQTWMLREIFIQNYTNRVIRLDDLSQPWNYVNTGSTHIWSSLPHQIRLEERGPTQFTLSYTHYIATMPIHLDCTMILQTSRSRSYGIDYACTGKLSSVATRSMANTLDITITPDTPAPAPSQYLDRSLIKETLDPTQ